MGAILLFIILGMCCGYGDDDRKRGRRKSYSERRRRDAWLDQAWFHDHGQNL